MFDVGKMVDAVLDAVDKPLRAFAERLKAVEARTPEKGEPGRDGIDGKNGIDGKDGFVGAKGDAGPQGVPGEQGRDGRDGLPGLQGEKGIDGKDGVDGLGFADLDVKFDGERTLTLVFQRGDKATAFGFSLPCMIYRGVWRDGDFHRGDSVTHGGSMWVAMKNTTTKPDTPGCEWQLSVKRGRDGKDGKPGERGATGASGVKGDRGDSGFGV